jgi:hypothetical protein
MCREKVCSVLEFYRNPALIWIGVYPFNRLPNPDLRSRADKSLRVRRLLLEYKHLIQLGYTIFSPISGGSVS